MSLVQEQERSLLSMSKIYLDKLGYENYLKSLEDIKKEIDENAKLMSLYVSDDAYGENWLRINCKLIDDSSNTNAKSKFLEEFDDLEEAGYSLDNPDMQVLYMSNVEAILYDEDGNELEEYKF